MAAIRKLVLIFFPTLIFVVDLASGEQVDSLHYKEMNILLKWGHSSSS